MVEKEIKMTYKEILKDAILLTEDHLLKLKAKLDAEEKKVATAIAADKAFVEKEIGAVKAWFIKHNFIKVVK
jgi:hypothetical protein